MAPVKKLISESYRSSCCDEFHHGCFYIRESHRERGDNVFPRCALIRGMHETSNADWWDATVT